MNKHAQLVACTVICCCCLGCFQQRRVDLRQRTGGSAFLFGQFQAYDGASGRPLHFVDITRRCRDADVILFGEQHGDAVCNQLEAQLLHALLDRLRPVALAMEFFEADTQAAIDAYLNGRIDEAAFLRQTRQKPPYWHSHRPLMELSHAARVPVLAANAPRRLVTAYRKSPLPYARYRAELDAEDRGWLPMFSEPLEGPYRDRFADAMRSHTPTARPASQPASQATTWPSSQPVTRPASAPASMPARPDWRAFFKAQLLWDDAMAETVANFRDRFPRWRVFLIVGGFHVAHDGGTALKLQQRRPADQLLTIIYRDNPDGQFAFRQEDRGAGDVVIYGIRAPKSKPRTMPRPSPKPETQPATASASAPSSAPSGPAVPSSRPRGR